MERERFLYLFRLLKQLAAEHRSPRRSLHPDHVIVAVFLWAVLCDRSVMWACRQHNWPPGSRRFDLPSQSSMSRRLRHQSVIRLFDALADVLRQCGHRSRIKIIDGKPLPVSRHSRDSDARFGRGAGGLNKGYKLYAIWPEKQAFPDSWEVLPMNASEAKVGCHLVENLNQSGYLLGDSAYDNNRLYDAAARNRQQMLAYRRYPKARGLGHHRHSPHRLRALDLLKQTRYQNLLKRRRNIETYFGNLTSFGGGLTHLPPWARRLHRVRLWVYGKLLINAVRIIQNKQNQCVAA